MSMLVGKLSRALSLGCGSGDVRTNGNLATRCALLPRLPLRVFHSSPPPCREIANSITTEAPLGAAGVCSRSASSKPVPNSWQHCRRSEKVVCSAPLPQPCMGRSRFIPRAAARRAEVATETAQQQPAMQRDAAAAQASDPRPPPPGPRRTAPSASIVTAVFQRAIRGGMGRATVTHPVAYPRCERALSMVPQLWHDKGWQVAPVSDIDLHPSGSALAVLSGSQTRFLISRKRGRSCLAGHVLDVAHADGHAVRRVPRCYDAGCAHADCPHCAAPCRAVVPRHRHCIAGHHMHGRRGAWLRTAHAVPGSASGRRAPWRGLAADPRADEVAECMARPRTASATTVAASSTTQN